MRRRASASHTGPRVPESLLQGAGVKSNRVGEDFKWVIAANIAVFQKPAKPYDEGVEGVKVAARAWAVVFSCSSSPPAPAPSPPE